MAHNALFDLGFLQAAIRETGCCPLKNPVMDTLQLARRCILNAYVMVDEGGTKELTDRRVTPRSLDYSRGVPCLIAYCHADHMEKTFRLDRIREFRLE